MVNHPTPKIKAFVDMKPSVIYNEAKETVLYE